mgnify:CR=1 FL=1
MRLRALQLLVLAALVLLWHVFTKPGLIPPFYFEQDNRAAFFFGDADRHLAIGHGDGGRARARAERLGGGRSELALDVAHEEGTDADAHAATRGLAVGQAGHGDQFLVLEVVVLREI